jgi:sec-independent protein translocase protein TatB
MFDFGFAELFVIFAVGILVVGPKDIPALLQNLGKGVRRIQYMKYALSQQFEEFMKDNDLNEVRHLSVDPMGNNTRDKTPQTEMTPLAVDQNGEPIETTPEEKKP